MGLVKCVCVVGAFYFIQRTIAQDTSGANKAPQVDSPDFILLSSGQVCECVQLQRKYKPLIDRSNNKMHVIISTAHTSTYFCFISVIVML